MGQKADERVLTAIKKREDLERPTVSVIKLLDLGKNVIYSNLCCNRIADAELIDGQDVQIDFLNFPDIKLTVEGMLISKEILRCYISEKLYDDMLDLLSDTDVLNSGVNDIARILRNSSFKTLYKTLKGMDTRKYDFLEMDDAQVFAEYIRKEMWQRSVAMKIIRKVRMECITAYTKVRYREMISIMKQGALAVQETAQSENK